MHKVSVQPVYCSNKVRVDNEVNDVQTTDPSPLQDSLPGPEDAIQGAETFELL